MVKPGSVLVEKKLHKVIIEMTRETGTWGLGVPPERSRLIHLRRRVLGKSSKGRVNLILVSVIVPDIS